MVSVAARSLLRSGRVSTARVASGVKLRALPSPFGISSSNSLSSRLLRSNPVEMSRVCGLSLLPYQSATASALLTSMLSVAPQGSAWNIEGGSAEGESSFVKRAYRDLLKAVDKHMGRDERNAHLREFIREEFRKKGVASAEISNKLKVAGDYVFYLTSAHHHKELLLSYNIAVDRSNEMKRVLKKSAASVGLQLPEVYQP